MAGGGRKRARMNTTLWVRKVRETQERWGGFSSPEVRQRDRELAQEAGDLVLTRGLSLPLCASGKAPSALWASISPPGNMRGSPKMTLGR